MGFVAKHDVGLDGHDYKLGQAVEFTDMQIERYREEETGPIAELLAAGAIEGDLEPFDGERVLAKLNAAELTELARSHGIDVPARATRAQLIELIQQTEPQPPVASNG